MKKYRRWIQIGLPLLIVLAWLTGGVVGGPYFGKIDEVASNDLASFLPASAESTEVKEALEKFQQGGVQPAIVVFESRNPLTTAERDQIDVAREALQNSGETKGEVREAVVSKDKHAAFLVVPLNSNSEFEEVIGKLKSEIESTGPSIAYHFTGPAMFSRDLNNAFAGIDGTLLFVALSVVFVILLVVYRSIILPIVTLMGAILALGIAIFAVWHLADAGIVQLNGQVQGILFILVIGAATDYALLYISRYREELLDKRTAWEATKATWKASWEPILAAGGTVTLGLMCLLVSDLGSNKALGPVGGIGIVLAVLSALTFLPAVLLLFGRAAFWPRRPKYDEGRQAHSFRANHPLWSRVGDLVGRHPRRLWVSITVVLLVGCIFVPQFRAEGVSQTDLILGYSEARDGQDVLDRHFPGGSGTPLYVLTPKSDTQQVLTMLEADKGIDTVSILTTNDKLPSMPVGRYEQEIRDTIREQVVSKRDEQIAALKSQTAMQMAGYPESAIQEVIEQQLARVPSVDTLVAQAYPFADESPKVVDGFVVLQAVVKEPASSPEARDTVARLRGAVQADHPEVKFGGISAIQLDINIASEHDLRTIIPLILVVITIVLMLLLRAIVAPIILLLTTVLSFGATIGLAAILFNNVWQFSGADPSVVIFGFVFLVALGIDYNIFLMTRVREETKTLGVRNGTLKALIVTGGVITSAGVVLAATFAALYVIPILFLAQIAFVVAFGVMLDTLIVRSLLVPSLTLEIGKRVWWPSKLSRSKK
ncbi:MAG: efflux RND transporter permease subunit [Candidatus Saccharimonas sp.]